MFNKRKGQQNSPRTGQSTVEYIVLVAAVIAVAIGFMTSQSGPFQTKLNSTMTTVTSQMTNMADRLNNASFQIQNIEAPFGSVLGEIDHADKPLITKATAIFNEVLHCPVKGYCRNHLLRIKILELWNFPKAF